jgi:hypothetical protein
MIAWRRLNEYLSYLLLGSTIALAAFVPDIWQAVAWSLVGVAGSTFAYEAIRHRMRLVARRERLGIAR